MLARLGIEFTTRPASIDESQLADEAAADHVLRLAETKAQAEAAVGELVLAADTVVVVDGEILGKPRDVADARAMLQKLSGRRHRVLTGVAVYDRERSLRLAQIESTRVRFADLSEEEIDWYVATGEPLDKAGAYAIQGLAALFIDAIEGNYSNVVGLPLSSTYRLLRAAGLTLLKHPST